MHEYTVYLNDDEGTEITLEADSFAISKEGDIVYFKATAQLVGFFKMTDIVGVAKQ